MNAHDAPTAPHKTLESTQPMTGKPPVTVYDPPFAPPAPPRNPPARLPMRPQRVAPPQQRWWVVAGVGVLVGVLVLIVGGLLFVSAALGRGILPAVSVAGVRIGGMSVQEAERVLSGVGRELLLTENGREWRINVSELGLRLDARASAERAYEEGRSVGDVVSTLFGRVELAPIVTFDIATAEAYFIAQRNAYTRQPVNAGIGFAEGQVFATPAQDGAELDIQATLARIFDAPASVLTSGTLQLATVPLYPAVTDASATLANARALLESPLEIRVFDPVSGAAQLWTIPPSRWGNWLTAHPSPDSAIGLALQLDEGALRGYLTEQASAVLDSTRTLDIEAGIASLQASLIAGNPRDGFVTVKHYPRVHTVRSGETITSIAWDYGFPYPYIQEANNNIQGVSVGQQIIIPPADTFLTLPTNPNKRVVVSISQQRTRVYENGQLIHDWVSSTGIADSPTWTGLYQVISRVPNAYAGNWNLYMPYFIGVYRPIPNADFTNGFHGFPTRGGGQILWENSLGRRVTFGCILLNNTNAKWLYDWVEEGVVVEILP